MKVLLICYKIEDKKGSEDGSGYNLAKRLATSGITLTLVSRANNIALLKNDDSFKKVELVSVDVPNFMSFYKYRERGIILYYYLWQIFVGLRVWKLQSSNQFDVIHLFNFHTDWAPHFLFKKTGKEKLVWGPIAHHNPVPLEFLRFRGAILFVLKEWTKKTVKHIFWLNPFLKWAIKRTDEILYACTDLAPPFLPHSHKIRFQTYAGSIDTFKFSPVPKSRFQILSIGRLVPLKGLLIGIDAFTIFLKLNSHRLDFKPNLVIIGSGALANVLKQKVADNKITHLVTFLENVDQIHLTQYYRDSAVFLFPSFEGQGLVVAEALAASLPVICLEGTGPALLAGESALKVPLGSYDEVIHGLGDCLQILHQEFSEQHQKVYLIRAKKAHERYLNYLDWGILAENILHIYRESGT